MHSFLVAIYSYFLSPLLTLLLFLIFGYVIMSWLIAFGVVSTRNQTVRQIQYALDSVMLPMLRLRNERGWSKARRTPRRRGR